MTAIYRRELRSFFQNVIGQLFVAATLMLTGLYFTVYNLLYGYPYISYALTSVTFLFMITVPILTMKVLAEERKLKTDQLLLTAPVSVGQIVIGKFLAMATVFTAAIAVICLYPIILSFFGEIPMGESYTAILGYYLMGLVCIAIGMFISSLTESQVIAAVLTFAILFLGYMMNSICSIISSDGNLLTKLLKCFDLATPFDNFMNGMLDLTSVVYYISLLVLFLFFTIQSIQKRRWQVSVKKIKTGAYSSGLIVTAVLIAIAANLFVGELPGTVTQIDVTSQKLYSLTKDTETFLKKLEKDVTIYVIAAESGQDTTLGETLERYESMSDHIRVVYKDPKTSPNFYKEYTDTISSNSLIIVSDSSSKVVDYNSIYVTEYDYYSYSSTVTGYDAEGQITSAISYVTGEDLPVVYQLEGHGEYELDAGFTEILEKENITLETINLLQYDQLPEDAACVFLLGPTSDLSSDDADKIIDYLSNGGKVILSVNYTTEKLPNFDRVLEACGLTNTYQMVVENDMNCYYQSPYYLLPEISSSTYTSGVYGEKYIFAPYCMAVNFDSASETLTLESLLSSTSSSYGKDPQAETYEYEEGDAAGPFTIGGIISDAESGAQTAYVTSAYLFTDSADQMVSGANSELFANVIAEFAGGEESVSVAAKNYSADNLTITQTYVIILGLVFTILLPLVLLVMGVVIWMNRRKR